MEVTIRRLKSYDWRRGFAATLNSLSPVHIQGGEEDFQFRFEKLSDLEFHFFFVALDPHARVVGCLTVFIEQKFIHSCGRVAHIEDVAVHADAQHHGIATKLMEHAKEVAKSFGCYKIILDCSEENVGFYEKLGYHRKEVQMRLTLDPNR